MARLVNMNTINVGGKTESSKGVNVKNNYLLIVDSSKGGCKVVDV
jgi:uncharacterized protein YunC (DUF1805 family)